MATEIQLSMTRVPPDVAEWLAGMAEATGLSVPRLVKVILITCKAEGWHVGPPPITARPDTPGQS